MFFPRADFRFHAALKRSKTDSGSKGSAPRSQWCSSETLHIPATQMEGDLREEAGRSNEGPLGWRTRERLPWPWPSCSTIPVVKTMRFATYSDGRCSSSSKAPWQALASANTKQWSDCSLQRNLLPNSRTSQGSHMKRHSKPGLDPWQLERRAPEFPWSLPHETPNIWYCNRYQPSRWRHKLAGICPKLPSRLTASPWPTMWARLNDGSTTANAAGNRLGCVASCKDMES